MKKIHLRERLSSSLTARQKRLLTIGIWVFILACLTWTYWPVSLGTAAGAVSQVQSISIMDVSSPYSKLEEKQINDAAQIDELLSLRVRRSVLTDRVSHSSWGYILYFSPGESGAVSIFLTEDFIEIGSRRYILLDKPAFLELRDRIYQ